VNETVDLTVVMVEEILSQHRTMPCLPGAPGGLTDNGKKEAQ
jgi:hypothetical protein